MDNLISCFYKAISTMGFFENVMELNKIMFKKHIYINICKDIISHYKNEENDKEYLKEKGNEIFNIDANLSSKILGMQVCYYTILDFMNKDSRVYSLQYIWEGIGSWMA